ncbi:MAG: Flavodoxin reductases (ferredoxin-NADPH reductases) family 1 [Cytophagales bacterium]|jgi:uncharacterized protein YcbX|nr:MOSC domain-containing protein [Bacteroidota bacterium]MBS1980359.1 MOSC domain-containing protein [Bacteroidota bacterium]WHZ07671.1 MAG: Flavodoxin reductases (ferredoxin-NADPH reductases) family 1 [Cytophagales bacterium]
MDKKLLSEIWIYPIKSLGGVRVKSVRVLEKGLERDRRWMLIDQKNTFMTQRLYPQMTLFKLQLTNNNLQVTHQENTISIPAEKKDGRQSIRATIWNDQVDVVEGSSAFSQWFSDRLKMNCKLVFFPEKNLRPVDLNYQQNHEHVSLADAFPFLLIGEESLADLNSRLKEPILMNRFRPNFVFSGGQAYEEDNWKNFLIGKNKFAVVKPCARCVIPTINQDTGTKGSEPLATLTTYRKKDNKVLFGQNVLGVNINTHEEVHEGDEIVLE